MVGRSANFEVLICKLQQSASLCDPTLPVLSTLCRVPPARARTAYGPAARATARAIALGARLRTGCFYRCREPEAVRGVAPSRPACADSIRSVFIPPPTRDETEHSYLAQ